MILLRCEPILHAREISLHRYEISLHVREMTLHIRDKALHACEIHLYACEQAVSGHKFTKNVTLEDKKMTDDDVNEFDAVVRMIDFKNAHSGVFGSNQRMKNGFIQLDLDIAVLEASGASRVSSRGLRTDGTADKSAAKSALNRILRNIIETARTIKKAESDFDNRFRVRRGTLSGQEMLDIARAFALDLTEPVAQKFADFGRVSATATNLNAAADAYEAARTQQNEGKGGSVAATAEEKAAIGRIRKNRQAMAVIGKNILEETGDAGLLAEWKAACKVERRRSSKNNPPENPPVP